MAATLLRRVVTIPSYALACLLCLGTAPLWVPAAALFDRVRGGVALRSGLFVAFYLICELTGLAICGALWLLRPFARWDAAQWRRMHFRIQDAWGASLLTAAVRLFGLRMQVYEHGAGPLGPGARLGEGPYLLLLRHASTADTLLASALIGRAHGVRLRYVLKRELLWDPCLDVVGQRLGHVFVNRASDDSRREIERVQALAADLSPRDGVLIYPEGTRYSESKRARVLAKLAREGDAKQLEFARSLHGLLPPQTGGTLGLLAAAPHADVVICAHTGFEGAATLAQLWRGELLHAVVRVRFERIARSSIPATRDGQAEWLRERWQEMDAWLARQRVR